MSRKKPFSEFLSLVKADCKKHGYRFFMGKRNYVTTSGTKVTGYFCDAPKILAIATKAKDYEITLAHEYCHLTQVVDNIALWKLCDVSSIKVDDWLAGKQVKDIKHHISIVRSLELDNEMRTANLMDIYDFGISKEDYTRKANAYIMFHNWLLTSRRWSKVGKSASHNEKIINAMSDKFDMDYSKLSPKLRRLFKREDI